MVKASRRLCPKTRRVSFYYISFSNGVDHADYHSERFRPDGICY